MEKEKLRVLIINDMVIFPNNEVRIEYDKNFDKQMSETFDCDDELILIVNPIDESNVDIMSLPNYGVLGRIKLKLNVPNGKTRVVLEGLKRVEITNYVFEDKNYEANYNDISVKTNPDEENYISILIKHLEQIGKHTSELQSRFDLVCRLLLEKKNKKKHNHSITNNNNVIKQTVN